MGFSAPIRSKVARDGIERLRRRCEQKNFTDPPPCSHMHIDTDDMELFTQRQKVPPIFDVPVSEQLLEWSERKFQSGEAFVYNYKESVAKLLAALTDRYSEPTYNNEQQRLTKGSWSEKKLEIRLSFGPVAKPSIGSVKPPQTSISLSFGKTE